MKRTIKLALFFAALSSLLLAAGCGGGNSSDQNAGFTMATFHTIRQIDQFGNVFSQFDVPQPATISGVHLYDKSGASGSVFSFGPVNSPSRYTITGARAPAGWRLSSNLSFLFFCAPLQSDFEPNRGGTVNYKCLSNSFIVVFFVSPGSIDAQAPPSTVTIYGSGISTAYGMPLVTAYDEIGNVVGQEPAQWVSPDGTSLVINTPSGLNVANTTYSLSVENIAPDGTQSLAGTGSLYVYNVTPYEPPPDEDPCGTESPYRDQSVCELYLY